MGFLRHLLGVFAAVVFCAFGATAGFAVGAAQSLYAGTLDGTAPDESDTAAYAAWQAQVADQAQLIGASVGYITSAGLASNVSNGGSIAQSGVVNNYLSHVEAADLERAREELAACSAATNCDESAISALETIIETLENLDQERNAQLREACEANPTGDTCVTHITAALIAAEFYRDPLPVDRLLPFSLDTISYQELKCDFVTEWTVIHVRTLWKPFIGHSATVEDANCKLKVA